MAGMKVLTFREQLIETLDQAFTLFLLFDDKSWDENLDMAADMMEEVLGEELGRALTQMFMGMTNDLNSTQKALLEDVEELRSRKALREKLHKEQKVGDNFSNIFKKANDLMTEAKGKRKG